MTVATKNKPAKLEDRLSDAHLEIYQLRQQLQTMRDHYEQQIAALTAKLARAEERRP